MSFFEHDRRKGLETRFAELILGMVAFSYGWQALKAPSPGKIISQFQVLLLLERNSFEIGIALCIFGVGSTLFAYSRFYWARLGMHAALVFCWLCVVMLFLFYREPGIPLLNGIIFGMASAIVIATVLFHEKHAPPIPTCPMG